jgi:hypothetical protein
MTCIWSYPSGSTCTASMHRAIGNLCASQDAQFRKPPIFQSLVFFETIYSSFLQLSINQQLISAPQDQRKLWLSVGTSASMATSAQLHQFISRDLNSRDAYAQ